MYTNQKEFKKGIGERIEMKNLVSFDTFSLYGNIFVMSVRNKQQNKVQSTSKTCLLFDSFLCSDPFATLASHICLISLSLFLSFFFQRDDLTEHGAIQPEGTVSGRRSLSSCKPRVEDVSLQSYPPSVFATKINLVWVLFLVHLLGKMNCSTEIVFKSLCLVIAQFCPNWDDESNVTKTQINNYITKKKSEAYVLMHFYYSEPWMQS